MNKFRKDYWTDQEWEWKEEQQQAFEETQSEIHHKSDLDTQIRRTR